MDRRTRALAVFLGATVGAAGLHKAAWNQAAKTGLPHVTTGLIAALIDYGI